MYGAYRAVKKKEAELDAKTAEIIKLRQTVSNLHLCISGEADSLRVKGSLTRRKEANRGLGGRTRQWI